MIFDWTSLNSNVLPVALGLAGFVWLSGAAPEITVLGTVAHSTDGPSLANSSDGPSLGQSSGGPSLVITVTE